MKVGLRIAAFLVAAVLVLSVIIYGGLIDISAVSGHGGPTRWLFGTVMRNRVEREAKRVQVPNLDNEKWIMRGAAAYRDMCEACHAAPGVKDSAMAKGMTPEPPRLEDEVHEWTSAELFWITKHGIKMTGMPAWGPTHKDQELWELVAFLQRLPKLTAEEYKQLTSNAGDHQHDVPAKGQDHHH